MGFGRGRGIFNRFRPGSSDRQPYMTMTSRERIKTILALELPDRMGVHEAFWGETIRDYWVNEGYPEGTPPGEFFGWDIAGVAGTWFDLSPVRGQDETVEETEEWRAAKGAWGATLKHWKSKSGTPEHLAYDCDSPETWRRDFKPSVDHWDGDRVNIDTVRESYEKLRSGDRFMVFNHLGHFEILRALIGNVNMLESLLLRPEWIHDILGTFTQLYIDGFDYMMREVGKPDGFFLYDDLGFRNGPFMSPRTYEEVLMPHHKALMDFIHDNGLPVIWHSCGDVRKLVPGLIRAGINCLQPMEVKAGNDVMEFVRLYGDRIAFMGNMNVMRFRTNDRDVVREEIVPKLRALHKARVPYVFHSDHSIPPDVRFETYKFALELYRGNAAY